MKIIGAGLAGLLAANMLRHRSPQLLEKQAELPNNHSAVLRFRSRIVSDVTGIEFKKVDIIKSTLFWRNHIADALAYAEKCTGSMLSNRSIPNGVERAERYIAPPNLISLLASDLDISYNYEWDAGEVDGPVISTIPMPMLMGLLGYNPAPHNADGKCGTIFKSASGLNIRATVSNCDAYTSLYVPNPIFPYSRISLTGNELIVEVPAVGGAQLFDAEEIINDAAIILGIEPYRLTNIATIRQQYAKIVSIDEDVRKGFMHWATVNYNIYSLGRYAVWRPALLLDDLVQDVRKIEGWINKSNKYDMARDR